MEICVEVFDGCYLNVADSSTGSHLRRSVGTKA